MIQQHTLKVNKKATHRKKIFGRGDGSGHGSFSGRGCKGQLARSGHSKAPAWFEGGQTPITQKMPKKRGFNRTLKVVHFPVNLDVLETLDADSIVTVELLKKANIVNKAVSAVKILGNGTLTKKLIVKLPCSSTAQEKIIQAGGSVEWKKEEKKIEESK